MLVSVIIPTLNRTKLLRRALLSLYNQSSTNLVIEAVIVNDCSITGVDDIKKIVDGMPQFNSKELYFSIYSNDGPHGAANARNFGVSKAKGELITFLDDDDIYLEGRLDSLCSYYKEHQNEFSFISSCRLFESQNLHNIYSKKQKTGLVTLDENKLGNAIDIGILTERDLFNSIGGFDSELSAFEDWDLFIRLLEIKPGFKLARHDYLVNDSNDRSRVSDSESNSYYHIAAKHRGKFGDLWFYRLVCKGLSRQKKMTLSLTIRYVQRSKSLMPIKYYVSNKLLVLGVFDTIDNIRKRIFKC